MIDQHHGEAVRVDRLHFSLDLVFDLLIAQFYGDYAWKTEYRKHLSCVYGRYKMTFSGIHVNDSVSEEMLRREAELRGITDYRRFKDSFYVALTEKACKQIEIVDERVLTEADREKLRIESEDNRSKGIALADEICRQYRREGRFFDEILKAGE